jgi:hypothetical protein
VKRRICPSANMSEAGERAAVAASVLNLGWGLEFRGLYQADVD